MTYDRERDIMTEVKDKKTMEQTKEELKVLMKKLRGSEDEETLEKTKLEFKDLIKSANPLVIAMAENELVKEGFSQSDLMSACDVHLMLFKDAIENPNLKVPEGHPIRDFQEDHRVILKLMEDLRSSVKKIRNLGSYEAAKDELVNAEVLSKKILSAENHNVRQENTLFPILEQHGIEQPPAIMWAEHTEMKEEKKAILKLLENRKSAEFQDFVSQLSKLAVHLLEKFSVHTQKEEHILYIAAMDVITDQEWKDIKEECDNLGYFEKTN
jgi:uncharacterized protein